MLEILVKLVWDIIGERVTRRLKAVYQAVIPLLSLWFSGLPLLARWAVGATAAVVAAGGAVLAVLGSSHDGLRTAHEFAAVVGHSQDLHLSREELARGRLYVGVWSQALIDRYDQQLLAMRTGKLRPGETTWTVAEKMVALEGLKGIELHARDALDYFTQQVDPDCGCWREFYDPDRKGIYPRNVAVSAWIVTALQRGVDQPQPGFADFLKKTQLPSGAWPVLHSNSEEEGSTFATPWAIMALISLQARMPGDREIATEIRKGVNWLLDHRKPNGLWTLYPQGSKGAAHQVSLSNSGLAIVALHQALRAEANVVPEGLLTQWKARITLADRELLRHLKPGVAVDANESYNDPLPTLSEGLMLDRFQLLVLPWLVMGAVEAYPAGSLQERMSAVGFFDDFSRRLEVFDKEIRRTGNEWRIAEMLMAVRAWSDHTYLAGAPITPEPTAHITGG